MRKGGNMRMLFVDDNVDVAEMLAIMARRLLPDAHADFCAFPEGGTLGSYDVLVTDVRLGRRIDGVQLAEQYKRLNPKGYVVLVTGVEAYRDSPPKVADAVLIKPVIFSDGLKEAIQGSLRP